MFAQRLASHSVARITRALNNAEAAVESHRLGLIRHSAEPRVRVTVRGGRPRIWNDFYRVRQACPKAERLLLGADELSLEILQRLGHELHKVLAVPQLNAQPLGHLGAVNGVDLLDESGS
jgi:hypothetical protein